MTIEQDGLDGGDTAAARPAENGDRRSSRAARLFGLGVLSLLLAVPLALIGGIAGERAGYRAEAEREIAAAWGGAQTLTGPFLVVPVEARPEAGRGAEGRGGAPRRAPPLVLLPERLEIDSGLAVQMRRRGIFEIPVYAGRHELRVTFDPARAAGELAAHEAVLWSEAKLVLGIAEPRARRGAPGLTPLPRPGREGDPAPVAFESGTGIDRLEGIHARIGDPRASAGFDLTLELNGTGRIALTPAGRVTEARLTADWPHPGFAGAFLPERYEITTEGFEADWRVPHLARPLPQAFRGVDKAALLAGQGFGATLFQPIDLYHRAERAAKYGLFLIALSFGVLFLLERAAPRPPHVAQYALIGAAQCVFFLLLLSLAERVGFDLAYAAATAATVGLLTAYGWSVLGMGRRALRLTGALGLLYGAMHQVLASEDQALLMGSVLAFVAIAAVMWATRNEDWGELFTGLRPLRRAAQG